MLIFCLLRWTEENFALFSPLPPLMIFSFPPPRGQNPLPPLAMGLKTPPPKAQPHANIWLHNNEIEGIPTVQLKSNRICNEMPRREMGASVGQNMLVVSAVRIFLFTFPAFVSAPTNFVSAGITQYYIGCTCRYTKHLLWELVSAGKNNTHPAGNKY